MNSEPATRIGEPSERASATACWRSGADVTGTLATARQIAASSSFTIGLGKQAFYAQVDLDQPKAYAYAKEVMSMNALEADAQEGMAAFTERRRPTWIH